VEGTRLVAEAWGPGADLAVQRAPRIVGATVDGPAREPLPDVYPLVTQLARRFPGIRMSRTEAVMDVLVPAILEQKVTGFEARRAWQGLVRRYGEPAPGPAEIGLRLPPPASKLAAMPYYAYHPFGVEQRRADVVRRVASRASWFEGIVDLPIPEAHARLQAMPGIGPWTAAEVAVRALGDEDAVSVGDFHLPNLVAWALAGEPRGDDARMLELLEPYRGQRALVMRLLEIGGPRPPKYGPRLSPRGIEGI
jgi:3-methyladenine DNA glycosylase/8-oxoguanine DNA glycosylase